MKFYETDEYHLYKEKGIHGFHNPEEAQKFIKKLDLWIANGSNTEHEHNSKMLAIYEKNVQIAKNNQIMLEKYDEEALRMQKAIKDDMQKLFNREKAMEISSKKARLRNEIMELESKLNKLNGDPK